jgi:hypothetical protein
LGEGIFVTKSETSMKNSVLDYGIPMLIFYAAVKHCDLIEVFLDEETEQ